ncbi:hypothetical protein E2C01_075838 [Portunus trituberculatus]|uniref:Uncharacterized protein n=1 Tax=Portunus trituberculatus TaxID=210409 RepID=A0A5B7I767_PORTR|nr:hypothetical protein [Portunus trituberculatus]
MGVKSQMGCNAWLCIYQDVYLPRLRLMFKHHQQPCPSHQGEEGQRINNPQQTKSRNTGNALLLTHHNPPSPTLLQERKSSVFLPQDGLPVFCQMHQSCEAQEVTMSFPHSREKQGRSHDRVNAYLPQANTPRHNNIPELPWVR